MSTPSNPGSLFPPSLPPGGPSPAQVPPPPPAPPYPPPPGRYRRRSIFSGLLLVIVGVLLLIARLHPGISLGYIITHFWPVIIIVWGIAKLIERFAHAAGAPSIPMLTGGEIALIIGLMALLGLVAFGNWISPRLPRTRGFAPFDVLTQQATETRRIDVRQVNAPNSLFTINTPKGGINIHAGADNGLLVVGTATASADTEPQAQQRVKSVDLSFDGPNGNYQIHPVNANGNDVSVDLDVQLPRPASVTARTQRGDVTVSGLQGPADIATRNGDVQIHDIGANVNADLQNGDTHIRNVTGAVNFTGRGGGDVEIADVQDGVTIGGNVFGDVDVRNTPKGVHYASPRANVQIASLAGEAKIDNSDIEISRASGPIVITAKNQDVRLNDVNGSLDLNETHGDISVTFTAPPTAPINISNNSGDVTLNLPPQSAFTLSAVSKAGDITDDFAENPAHDDDHAPHHHDATYGSGGPAIHVATKYGDIHIGNSK